MVLKAISCARRRELEWHKEGRTSLSWPPHEEEVPVRGIGELLEDPLDHAGPRVLEAGPLVDLLEALKGLLVTDALYQVSGGIRALGVLRRSR